MVVEKSNKDYSVVELDLVKNQLNFDLDYTDEDEYLEQLKQVAIDYCESVLGFDIVPTDNQVSINDFCNDQITVNEGNLKEITSITLNGEDIVDYSVEQGYYSFKIKFKERLEGTLSISFTTGNTLRPKHLQAVLIKTSDLYDSERQSYNYNLSKNDVLKYLLTL